MNIPPNSNLTVQMTNKIENMNSQTMQMIQPVSLCHCKRKTLLDQWKWNFIDNQKMTFCGIQYYTAFNSWCTFQFIYHIHWFECTWSQKKHC